jgi:AmmeMemoRadiSam system protein A
MDRADTELGAALVGSARNAIAVEFGIAEPSFAAHPALGEPGASFVTLKRRDELRGCIGSLEPTRSLGRDVRRNAVAAAFHDPRFAPLELPEWTSTIIDVSVLSTPRPLAFADERALLEQVVPGLDGLILEHRGRRATFLPQVWERVPSPRDFLGELKRKAGLPADFPVERLSISCYRVVQWRETDLTEASSQ